MATPHIGAEKGDIARVVLMPGDPLRAKTLAKRYLTNVRCFNEVRNMLGFTGIYQGVELSVMGSGMGVPSMGIYSHELYNFFDVDTIIRVGTTGGIGPNVGLRDLVIAQAACTDSNFAQSFGLPGTVAPIADFDLMRRAVEVCERLGVTYHVGNVLCTDIFYRKTGISSGWVDMGVLGVEMEVAALYLNAMEAHKRAMAIMAVSDLPFTGASLPAKDRQESFTEMMEVALEMAREL